MRMGAYRAVSGLLFAALIAGAITCDRSVFAQTASPSASVAVAEVRQSLDVARKEIAAYRSGGGAAGAPDHPALKWSGTLWEYRQRYPRSEAAALASSESIRLLVRAEFWEQAHARVESLEVDDQAWEGVAAALYEEGSSRKDFTYAVAKLTAVATGATNGSIKSAALLALGRAQRRQGDSQTATATLEAARSAAPDTPFAKEAEGIIYEIAHLSLGLTAPAFSAKARSGRTIDLASLRGQPVVLVFWAST